MALLLKCQKFKDVVCARGRKTKKHLISAVNAKGTYACNIAKKFAKIAFLKFISKKIRTPLVSFIVYLC